MNEKGKILRLKSGYNPNSSSVGSHIPAFLFFAIGSGVFSVIISQMIAAASQVIRKNKADEGSK